MAKSLFFDVEDVRMCWPEIKPLAVLHREEVRGNEDESEPQQEFYDRLTEEGRLVFFTVRDGESKELVGYAAMIFADDNQRKGETFASQDAIFIRKSHRYGFAGLDFLRYIERECKSRGVKRIYQSVTPSVRFEPLLRRLGYTESTIIYAKKLE